MLNSLQLLPVANISKMALLKNYIIAPDTSSLNGKQKALTANEDS
jgi:hypothetical protein